MNLEIIYDDKYAKGPLKEIAVELNIMMVRVQFLKNLLI